MIVALVVLAVSVPAASVAIFALTFRYLTGRDRALDHILDRVQAPEVARIAATDAAFYRPEPIAMPEPPVVGWDETGEDLGVASFFSDDDS